MIPTLRLTPLLCLLALLPGVCRAQAADALSKEEQDLVKHCVGVLTTFAGVAKSQKVGQRAKQAYDLVLQYDQNQSGARSELGWKKDKDQWVQLPAEKRKRWVDKATFEGRFKVMDEWAKTAIKLGELHRKLGLKLKEAGNLERATYHLDKAVYYNAMDKEANIALGLKEGPGFYGTDAQITFAKKMKEIETKAIEIARRSYTVTELPQEQMPIELQNLRDQAPDWMKKPTFEISGAKSENFTIWTRGSQEHANTSAMWAERAVEFGIYLLGDDNAKKLQFKQRATRSYAQYIFLFTGSERDELLKHNEHIWKPEGPIERAKEFANNTWAAKEGTTVAMVRSSPRSVQDSLIGFVFFHGLCTGRNIGMGQGIVHAATWYMKSTSIVRWGARPEGSVTEDSLELPDSTNWWLRAIRDQAVSNQDWPMDQIPREQLSRFRNDCRMKAWSTATFLMAAYPDKWLQYYVSLPAEKVLQLEEIAEKGQKAFGKPLTEIENEWREWARGDSGVAFGTGYGPPLLPERPSKVELAVVDRINLIRKMPIGYTWPEGGKLTDLANGTWVGLTECEMDAEASMGCELHAKYVTKHRELAEKPGPEIHEEDPAHEDFTRRGQQAGSGNIVTSTGAEEGVDFAAETVDLWIGTPYHRFPMLEHNIKRLGYAYVFDMDFSVAVLDMGSLEEPYDPKTAPKLVAWPAPGMANVPTTFPAMESPNPLEDQPEGQQDPRKCGYTVSLQLQEEVARTLGDSSMELYESRKGGKLPAKCVVDKNSEDWKAWTDRCKPKEIPVYLHTPKTPLNKKHDNRDVIFVVPKEPLEANTQYQVRTMLRIGEAPFWFFWEFTTGTQARGLKVKDK
jgi:hypothetical protein